MDSRKSIDHYDPILGVSARLSVSSKEVTFADLGSKRIRHGSAGADSEMLSMSQKEIKDEDARLIYINDPDRTNERFEFTGNSIKTAKYSVFTFLPRNLFEQFHRVAYIYFLVIAVLNQLPQLAVFGRGASIMPLAFVLLVSAIKDAYEDFRRHRSDRVENNRLALVFEDNQFREKKWKHIRVGEVIKVQSNQTLPCDMVLLATSDPTGVVYVQTTNLDGESNLKTRYAKQETLLKAADMESFNGFIKCEKPNRNIYGFQANMEIDGRRLSTVFFTFRFDPLYEFIHGGFSHRRKSFEPSRAKHVLHHVSPQRSPHRTVFSGVDGEFVAAEDCSSRILSGS